MSNEGSFTIDSKDFEEVYKMADAVVSGQEGISKKGNTIETHETIAAKALMKHIDMAREEGLACISFTEQEVICLSSVVN